MNKNVVALLLIILSAGLYFTVTRGMIADAQAVKAVNDQYTSALSNAANLQTMLNQEDTQWADISASDRDRLDKMIPSSVDNIRLIIDLDNLAVGHGFSLSNVSATAPSLVGGQVTSSGQSSGSASVGMPTLDTVNVSFSVTASYDQFISFLQALEINLRVMDVTHLSVSVNDNGVYSYNVQLKTYWVRQ